MREALTQRAKPGSFRREHSVLVMRYPVLILVLAILIYSPVFSQDKNPRRPDGEKAEQDKDSGSKLDKIKDSLSVGNQDYDEDDNDDSDAFVLVEIFSQLWWDINNNYCYMPYPYFEGGLLKRDSSHVRPVHFEATLSGFAGEDNIGAVNFTSKLKLYTLWGFEFQYNGFTEDGLLDDSEMNMYRLSGVMNLLSYPGGFLELKFGSLIIDDVGAGAFFGFQADIAPKYPLILNIRADFAEINGHKIADYAFTFGGVYRHMEIFAGYNVFDLDAETIVGPIGGVKIRF